jgi:translation initiation factor IF-3
MFVNEEIYGYSVIVIDENGVSKGEINKKSAISQAKEQGFDLVQVSKDNKGIPICKFADAGKLKFEASKKKINNKPIETKEMMFHLKTGEHDIQVKKTKIRAMLEKKCFVKFGIELKGRENAFIVNAKKTAKMGTIPKATNIEAIKTKTIVKGIDLTNCPTIPVKKNNGTKAATVVSVPAIRGRLYS